jgi:DNA-binding PadR family transcriptional regulator
MSALSTRILVLGAVDIFGPANGYQLRRELISWDVERWANLKPGSIYSMLTTLEKQKAIERYDVALDDGRPVAVYTITESGREEFERLVYEGLATVPDSGDALPLRVCMNFAAVLTRARFLEALAERVRLLSAGVDEFDQAVVSLKTASTVPPHVVHELGFEVALMRTQLDWVTGLQAEVRGGGLDFSDDPDHGSSWAPAPDDPGWRMVDERQRYLAEIEKLRARA